MPLESIAWDRDRVLAGLIYTVVGFVPVLIFMLMRLRFAWWVWVLALVFIPIGTAWVASAKVRLQVSADGINRDSFLDHDRFSWDEVAQIIYVKDGNRFLLAPMHPSGITLSKAKSLGMPAGTWDAVLDPTVAVPFIEMCRKHAQVRVLRTIRDR